MLIHLYLQKGNAKKMIVNIPLIVTQSIKKENKFTKETICTKLTCATAIISLLDTYLPRKTI